ncbi:MAG: hypothetical protein N3A68_05655 [Bacteroidia bacterium]|jgi:hypothetical protein|nr:hypothetical protein [Bacteroidia bacterium]GIV24230.1 MAG: hypothetical protein KatS3mg025_1889 [Bacteroidia bacterium]
MFSLKSSHVGALAFVGAISMGWAQEAQIKRVLSQAQLEYKVLNSGNFALVFQTEGGRTQIVFINSQMEDLKGYPIIKLWSVVYQGKTLDKLVLGRLLLYPAQYKIVGSEITEEEGQVFGVYTIKIPFSAFTPNMAKALCEMLANMSDKSEAELRKGANDF